MRDAAQERQADAPPPPPPAQDGSQQLLPEDASRLSDAAQGDAADELVSEEVQTEGYADAAVQYEPPGAGADPAALDEQLRAPALAGFLTGAVPRCEAALQQNELLDAMRDELASLVDDDGAEGGAAGAGAAGRSAAAGLAELFSFSDLVHSKGRMLAAVAWHPSRRGVVAVACTQQQQQQQQAEAAAAAASAAGRAAAAAVPSTAGSGRSGTAQAPQLATGTGPGSAAASYLRQPPAGCILVWSHSDAIHPEAVLQPPAEALAFAFHPTAPHAWLAAGLVTGQVALFNLQQAGGSAAAAAGAAGAGRPGQRAGKENAGAEEGKEEGGRSAVLLPAFVSSPDACHQAPVTDLHWLPGAVITKDGQLAGASAGPAGDGRSGAAAGGAEGSSGATSAPAAPAPAAEACNLFATTAADGSLLVWDMRISTRLRKATKDEEAPEWRPVLALPSAAGQPLQATRFRADPRCGVGRFLVGTLEGELALADVAPNLQQEQHARAGGPSSEWVLSVAQQAAGHTGRVLSMAFSPFFSDTLLVVGDSGFVVWRVAAGASGAGSSGGSAGSGSGAGRSSNGGGSGGSSSAGTGSEQQRCLAIYESPFCADALYTCGSWSFSKPGVVLLGRADGRLEAWDLLDRSHQAAMVAPVSPCALTALAMSPAAGNSSTNAHGGRGAAQPQLVAVGDAAGTLRMLELPRALRRRGHAEVRAMAALLAQEQERLEEVGRRADARAAEAKAAADRKRAQEAAALGAARRQAQGAAKGDAGAAGDTEEGEEGEEAAAERRYLALEAEWRERLLGGGGAGGGGGDASVSAA